MFRVGHRTCRYIQTYKHTIACVLDTWDDSVGDAVKQDTNPKRAIIIISCLGS
jgi:hypothetical protein